jgi:hypothetical protein
MPHLRTYRVPLFNPVRAGVLELHGGPYPSMENPFWAVLSLFLYTLHEVHMRWPALQIFMTLASKMWI